MEVLEPFLEAANTIHGTLFTIAISKQIDLVNPSLLSEELKFLPGFKPSVAASLPVHYLLSVLVSGSIPADQEIVWLTDQDAIAANPDFHNLLMVAFGKILSGHLLCNVGSVLSGTTANDSGNFSIKDTASLPDFAAGASSEILRTNGLLKRWDATEKSRVIVDWLRNQDVPLSKRFCRPPNDGGQNGNWDVGMI